jgi:hypothetical protein
MKFFITIIITSIISISNAQIFPVTTILNNGGNNSNRVKMVFLSEGYTSSELPNFISQVNTFKADMLSQTPYKEYKNFIDMYAIQVPSNQSGTDHPATASDESSSGGQPATIADTYFNSTFDYAGIHRLVVCTNYSAINNVLMNNFPSYNQAFLFVNSPYYGGSGGTHATSTVNSFANEIAMHEIGHSFAGLMDEYFISTQPEAPNRTTDSNPFTNKWRNWVGINNIGIFNYGSSGSTNWFRPHQSCKMQYLGYPFCAVCTEATVHKIYQLVTPIDATTPAASAVNISGNTPFSAVIIKPEPNTLLIEWKLNGTTVASDTNAIQVLPSQLSGGTNTLTLYVTDKTLLSKKYLPAVGYVFSKTWNLTNTALPVELLSFQANKQANLIALTWQTASESNSSHFEIQRSFDGVNFTTIGTVKAAGNSQDTKKYSFEDKKLYHTATYYRLKQIDLDNSHNFSEIRVINKTDKFHYEIFPNPVIDELQINLYAEHLTDVKINVFNQVGNPIEQQIQEDVKGKLSKSLSTKNWLTGEYIINIVLPNGYIVNEKIVKINP